MGAPRVKRTTAQSDQFAALWRAGVPYDAILATMDISRWTLMKWRKALDMEPRYSGWLVHTPEVIERDRQLTQLWDEGHSTAEIGRRMGISKNAVVGRAHRLDLPQRPSPIKRDGYAPPRIRRAPRVTLPGMGAEIGSRVPHREPRERKASSLSLVPDTKPPPCPSQASAAAVDQAVSVGVAPQRVAPSQPRAKACFWTEGEPGAFVCCDADALRGSLFCLEHHQRGTVGDIATRHREAHRARAAA